MVYMLRKSKAFANWQGIHQIMMLKVKKLETCAASACFYYFIHRTWFWQLSRAREKTELLESFRERTLQPAISARELNTPRDWRFYQVEMEGKFDNAHTFLLDNKISTAKWLRSYTPFKPKGLGMTILVDRGFIPIGVSREQLPAIPKAPKGSVKIKGMLNTPPLYLALAALVKMAKYNGRCAWNTSASRKFPN